MQLGLRWKIVLAFLAVYLCWGMTYLAMRVAVRDIPPHLMSGARFLVAGLVLYLWTRRRGDPKPTAIQWRSAAMVGAFLLLGGNATVACRNSGCLPGLPPCSSRWHRSGWSHSSGPEVGPDRESG